ncbi:MAG: hypothetical protein HY221_02125 [Candidatus Sungbacteria bacterium]|uniref:Uncharacterized protein n=1 Tax=Candidatus Sungiibacteriota bacterium TaxID=2750080 RepID=A0A932VR30_9BACT|nr:hypothetical protein [Candidatus Sungbacteria bacterium]
MKCLLVSALVVCALISGSAMAQTREHPLRPEARHEQLAHGPQQENKEKPRQRREHRKHREHRHLHREQHEKRKQ